MQLKIPNGSKVFIDSNIFIYHFLGKHILSENCTNFLKNIEDNIYQGYTSVVVLKEVLHILMLSDVIEMHNLKPNSAVTYLEKHPEIVKKLTKPSDSIEKIEQMNIVILPLTNIDIIKSRVIRENYGLLTNDSINLFLIQNHTISYVATNDSDFDDVKHIHVWKPIPKNI